MTKEEIFEFINNRRKDEAFDRFTPNEPLALTKQRIDRSKGFIDNSPEGQGLGILQMINRSNNPKDFLQLFSDGFHSPARKQPSHPSFILNDSQRQAISMALHPDQEQSPTMQKVIADQVLDKAGGRFSRTPENAVSKTGLKEYFADLYPRYKEEILNTEQPLHSAMDRAGQTILRNREAKTRIPEAETRTPEERWRKHKKDDEVMLELERRFMSDKMAPERGAVVENGPNDRVFQWQNEFNDQLPLNPVTPWKRHRWDGPTLDVDRLINRFRGNSR